VSRSTVIILVVLVILGIVFMSIGHPVWFLGPICILLAIEVGIVALVRSRRSKAQKAAKL